MKKNIEYQTWVKVEPAKMFTLGGGWDSFSLPQGIDLFRRQRYKEKSKEDKEHLHLMH